MPPKETKLSRGSIGATSTLPDRMRSSAIRHSSGTAPNDARRFTSRAIQSTGRTDVGSQARAADRVKKLLMRKLRPLVKKMETNAELANAKIDTTSSYRAIQAKCRKW